MLSRDLRLFSPLSAEAGQTLPAKVRLCLVGVNFGAGIARHLRRGNPHVELAAICDLNETKGQALATELNLPFYPSLAEALAAPDIEALGLFTPPTGRADLVRTVIRAGKHVLTTKPFELNVAAARAVLAEAQALGRAVHLKSPAPAPSQDMACIQNWVKSHQLGRPIALRAQTWAHYREKATGTWQDDPARCPAAPLFRLGIYFLNDFAALLGQPARVHVMQSRIFTERPTADNAHLSIEFTNGSLASIFASFCVQDGQPYRDEVTLNYERGTIRRWMERIPAPDMSGDNAVLELQTPDQPVQRLATTAGTYAGWYDWAAFQQAVRSSSPASLQSPEDIIFGIRLLDAMARSAQSGQPEIVQP